MLIVLPLVIQNLKAALIGSGGDDMRIDAVDPNPGRPVECPDYPVDLGLAALKFHGYCAESVVSDPAGDADSLCRLYRAPAKADALNRTGKDQVLSDDRFGHCNPPSF